MGNNRDKKLAAEKHNKAYEERKQRIKEEAKSGADRRQEKRKSRKLAAMLALAAATGTI